MWVFFSIPYFTQKSKFDLLSSSASSIWQRFFLRNEFSPHNTLLPTIITKPSFTLDRRIYRLYSPGYYKHWSSLDVCSRRINTVMFLSWDNCKALFKREWSNYQSSHSMTLNAKLKKEKKADLWYKKLPHQSPCCCVWRDKKDPGLGTTRW